MARTRHVGLISAFSVLAIALAAAPALSQTAPSPTPGARVWADRVAEIEQYLKSAEIVGMEEIGVGVTKPRRATLAPGGPCEKIAWKPIRPGRYSGFWESYKSEVAAYELDKLLGMGMIPPTVEREVKGTTGAAVMWVSPVKSFKELGGVPGLKGVSGPPPAQIASWTRQITVAKMFDNLIGNIDPNLGNWLVDPKLESDPHRPHARLHEHEGLVPSAGAGRRRPVGQDEGARRSRFDDSVGCVARQRADQGHPATSRQDAAGDRQAGPDHGAAVDAAS